jgi:CheY-like chemotaxis protein
VDTLDNDWCRGYHLKVEIFGNGTFGGSFPAEAASMEDRVRLLFIDDDELVLGALKRTFTKEPYELFVANSGRLGLQIVAQKNIDIVVCDQLMPGMTGIEFFEILFEKHRNVMRVMLSGVGALPQPAPEAGPNTGPSLPIDLATKSKLNAAKTALKTHAYNEGQVHRYIEKPWKDLELKTIIADMAAIVRSTRRKRPSV